MSYSINENLILENLNGEKTGIRNFNTGEFYVLNKTAVIILKNIDKNIDEISSLILKNSIDNNISIIKVKEDITETIKEFLSLGFIRFNNITTNNTFKYVKVKNLYLEIISTCNKKCLYCYNEKSILKYEIIKIENIENIIKQCDPTTLEGVVLSGGEPLLYECIEDVFILCEKYNLKVAIVTNGSLINNEKAELLSKYNVNIQFTIDGYNEELNDLTRGESSFKSQINALSLLMKNDFKGFLNVRTNLWKGNLSYKNINGIVEICKKFNVSRLDLVEAKKNGSFKDVLLEKDYEKVSSIINNIDKGSIDIVYERDVEEFKCELDRELITIEFGLRISSSGDVYPCQYFLDKQFSIGNIYFDTLWDIVYGDKNKRIINLISIRKYFIEKCTTCIYGSKCNAGCPAKAYLNNNNIFSTDGSCYKRKLSFAKYYIK